MGSGREMELIPENIVDQVQTPAGKDRHGGGERTRLFFEAMKRVVDRELPGYTE
jgi:hypothetical protein